MTGDDLSTELWVTAHIRQCTAKGLPVYVARKGAPARGTVMVKILMPGKGCRLLNQSRDENGNMGWMNVFETEIIEENRADQYIQRAAERDPDIWVIDVEDMQGRNPFAGKVF